MISHHDIQQVFKNDPLCSSKELSEQGIYTVKLQKLVQNGELEEVTRGFYRLSTEELTPEKELQSIAKIIPKGVFCLQSALEFHGIGTHKAFEHQVAMPKSAWLSERPELNIRFFQFSASAYELGIEEHGNIKVYSIAKTIADCFKFRNQLGFELALEALKEVITKKKSTIPEIIDAARVCRVKNVMMPYLEVLF